MSIFSYFCVFRWRNTTSCSALCFFPQHYMLGQFSSQNQENFPIFFSGRMVLHCLGALQIFPRCLLMDMQGVSNIFLLRWKRLS